MVSCGAWHPIFFLSKQWRQVRCWKSLSYAFQVECLNRQWRVSECSAPSSCLLPTPTWLKPPHHIAGPLPWVAQGLLLKERAILYAEEPKHQMELKCDWCQSLNLGKASGHLPSLNLNDGKQFYTDWTRFGKHPCDVFKFVPPGWFPYQNKEPCLPCCLEPIDWSASCRSCGFQPFAGGSWEFGFGGSWSSNVPNLDLFAGGPLLVGPLFLFLLFAVFDFSQWWHDLIMSRTVIKFV